MTNEATLKELATIIARNGYLAYVSALGGATPARRKTFDWMKRLHVGNLVFKHTAGCFSVFRNDSDMALNAIGHLESMGREPVPIEGWNAEEDGPLPDEMVYYIRTLDGRSFRWTNASFIRIVDVEDVFSEIS